LYRKVTKAQQRAGLRKSSYHKLKRKPKVTYYYRNREYGCIRRCIHYDKNESY
jgi:hypothetical protein